MPCTPCCLLLKCASSQPSQYCIPDKPGSLQTNGGSGGVKTVQVKGPNSGWEGLSNTFGAEWEIPNQPSLPIDLHVISDSGQEVSTAYILHTHPKRLVKDFCNHACSWNMFLHPYTSRIIWVCRVELKPTGCMCCIAYHRCFCMLVYRSTLSLIQ